jgi:hypothetical protein
MFVNNKNKVLKIYLHQLLKIFQWVKMIQILLLIIIHRLEINILWHYQQLDNKVVKVDLRLVIINKFNEENKIIINDLFIIYFSLFI